MVLPVPLVHSWSTLILLGPLRVTTLQNCGPRCIKVDQGDHGDHGAGCWTRSTVVLLLHFADVRMMLPVMNLLIFANQHPGLCGNIVLYEVESTNQRNTLISLLCL